MASIRSGASSAISSKEDFAGVLPVREQAKGPDMSLSNIAHYLSTRITSLKPPILQKGKVDIRALNPMDGIMAMKASHWNKFLHGFSAWTIDAMDFFCVSVSASAIAASLDVNVTSITWGLTLVLMLRSVGAVIFGYAADRWGRKWPLIACYTLFIILEIATGFVKTLKQFLAVRSLFGIVMGGCYGVACATALEDIPQKSRGVMSGLFLPGYNLGFILATIFYRAFQSTSKDWQGLFWFSAGPPFLLLLWRLSFDEMEYFKELKTARDLHNQRIEEAHAAGVTLEEEGLEKITFWSEFKKVFRTDWPLMVYLIFMMSGFNFISHGSQDLFPTMLKKQLGLSIDAVTITNVVVNMGAIVGGVFWGYVSEVAGRRLAILGCCVWGGAFLYGTFFKHDESSVMGFGFFLQFAVMGAWGICSLHLTELCSRSSLRTLISGTAYQLGNLASSASSTIESQIGSQFPLEGKGEGVYDYGKVMCIFMGCVFGFLFIVILLGPERYHEEIKTDFMVQAQDVDKEYELDQVLNPVPHSQLDEKLMAAIHREHAIEEQKEDKKKANHGDNIV